MEATEVTKKGNGMTAGIIACVLAVLGILFLGFIFVPIAVVIAIFGTFIAIKNRNLSGIGVNVLAWVLIVVGFISSPALLLMVGFTASQAGDENPFNSLESKVGDVSPKLATTLPAKTFPQKTVSEYSRLISGLWVGEYLCMQEATGVTLTISSKQDDSLEAIFSFYPTKANPKAKEGEFSMKGDIDSRGLFSLTPVSWVKRPPRFSMVRVDGQLNDEENSISGKIIYSGCSTISLSKK